MEPLKNYLKKKKTAKKNIHTSRHALAEELAEYFNEPKNYRKYLGICYQRAEEDIRRIFSEIKQEEKRNPKISPVKIFFWKLKQLEKLPAKKNIKKRKRTKKPKKTKPNR